MSSDRTRGVKPFLFRDSRGFVKPPSLPKNFLYSGLGLYLGHIDALIAQRGIRVQHTESVACPCHDVQRYGGTGISNPSCVSCHGLGIAFVEDTLSEMRALVSEIDEREGKGFPEGSVRVTFPSGTVISTSDRLVFPDVLIPIALMRKYRKSVGGIKLPFYTEDVEVLVTKGARPDDPLIHLVKGLDFTLLPKERLLVFPRGSSVTDGMVVSGEFMAVPEYIVESTPKAFRSMLSSLSDDAKTIQLPKYVNAVRADVLIGLKHKEISGGGSADV